MSPADLLGQAPAFLAFLTGVLMLYACFHIRRLHETVDDFRDVIGGKDGLRETIALLHSTLESHLGEDDARFAALHREDAVLREELHRVDDRAQEAARQWNAHAAGK